MHTLGNLNDLFALACRLVDAMRELSGAERDRPRLRELVETVDGVDRLSEPQKAAATEALYRVRTGPRPLRKLVEDGTIDDDRVSTVVPTSIMAWDAEQQLWCTVVDPAFRKGFISDLSAVAVTCAMIAPLIPEGASASDDPDNPPFYKRTLESFSDEVITRARQSTTNPELWYASLDAGPEAGILAPDYTACASTKEAAVKQCARMIRDRLPARSSGYEMKFQYQKHWADKECIAVAAASEIRPACGSLGS